MALSRGSPSLWGRRAPWLSAERAKPARVQLLWCVPLVYLVICFLGFVYDVISFYGSKTKLLSCRTFTLPEYLRRSASYEDERVDTSLEVTGCRITEFLEALRQASNQEPEFFEHFGATHRVRSAPLPDLPPRHGTVRKACLQKTGASNEG